MQISIEASYSSSQSYEVKASHIRPVDKHCYTYVAHAEVHVSDMVYSGILH